MDGELTLPTVLEKRVSGRLEGRDKIAVDLCPACAIRFVVIKVVILALNVLSLMFWAEIGEVIGIVRLVFALGDGGSGEAGNQG
jgi:hypothetical protein